MGRRVPCRNPAPNRSHAGHHQFAPWASAFTPLPWAALPHRHAPTRLRRPTRPLRPLAYLRRSLPACDHELGRQETAADPWRDRQRQTFPASDRAQRHSWTDGGVATTSFFALFCRDVCTPPQRGAACHASSGRQRAQPDRPASRSGKPTTTWPKCRTVLGDGACNSIRRGDTLPQAGRRTLRPPVHAGAGPGTALKKGPRREPGPLLHPRRAATATRQEWNITKAGPPPRRMGGPGQADQRAALMTFTPLVATCTPVLMA